MAEPRHITNEPVAQPDFSILDNAPDDGPDLPKDPQISFQSEPIKPVADPDSIEPVEPLPNAEKPKTEETPPVVPGANADATKGLAGSPDLSKGTEPPKADAAAAVKPPVADEEIDKFQPKLGSSPKIQNDFKVMKEGWKLDRQKGKDLEAKVKELEAKASTTPDPIKLDTAIKERDARIAELEKYEFLVAPEHSSFVTKEYDSKIEKANDGIYAILKAHGLQDKTEPGKPGLSIESFKNAGGPISQSLEWWETNIFPNIPAIDRKRIENGLLAIEDTKAERAKAIAETPAKREEYLGQKKAEGEAKAQESISRMTKRVQELLPQVPYGQIQEIPKDATPEKKAEIESLNKFHQEAQTLFPKLVNPESPEKAVEAAHGFLYSLYQERHVLPALKAENASLKEKLATAEELAKGLSSTGRTRSTQPPSSKPNAAKKGDSLLGRSEAEALALLDAED